MTAIILVLPLDAGYYFGESSFGRVEVGGEGRGYVLYVNSTSRVHPFQSMILKYVKCTILSTFSKYFLIV